MKITKFWAKGFRSLRDVTLDWAPVTSNVFYPGPTVAESPTSSVHWERCSSSQGRLD